MVMDPTYGVEFTEENELIKNQGQLLFEKLFRLKKLFYDEFANSFGQTLDNFSPETIDKKVREFRQNRPHLYLGKLSSRKSYTANDRKRIKFLQESLRRNNKQNLTTFVFITDYSSLWITKLEECFSGEDFDKSKLTPDETLDLYLDPKVNIKYWFKISDINLISSQMDSTVLNLKKFYLPEDIAKEVGLRREIDQITPYRGRLIYPLPMLEKRENASTGHMVKKGEPDLADIENIISKDSFSKQMKIDHLFELTGSHECLQAYQAIFSTGRNKVIDNITRYCIPYIRFHGFNESIRNEIIAAELHVLDNGFNDLDTVVKHYFKALELIFNQVIKEHVAKSIHNDHVLYDKRLKKIVSTNELKTEFERGNSTFSFDEYCKRYISKLSELPTQMSPFYIVDFVKKNIKNNPDHLFFKCFEEKFDLIEYFAELNPLMGVKKKLHLLRNRSNHSIHEESLTNKEALFVRNSILGIGEEGLLNGIQKRYSENKTKKVQIKKAG